MFDTQVAEPWFTPSFPPLAIFYGTLDHLVLGAPLVARIRSSEPSGALSSRLPSSLTDMRVNNSQIDEDGCAGELRAPRHAPRRERGRGLLPRDPRDDRGHARPLVASTPYPTEAALNASAKPNCTTTKEPLEYLCHCPLPLR
mgnify:CR=1 FL=1